MATEKIRVGVIGASLRNGWGRDAHIPALSALREYEITAICTSRQETADETAKHFGIPLAFADPYKMVQHPDVDLVSICVGVPFHHQPGDGRFECRQTSLLRMAARGHHRAGSADG
jgi:predicted dehydrogenase